MIEDHLQVIGGVDTHSDTHTAAAIDSLGRLLGHHTFPTTRVGYQSLLSWLTGHGCVQKVGIEGTGSYGSGLARHMAAAGITVIEVDRPNRANRRRRGKSDPIDAEAAARAVLAGTATGTPKSHSGAVESLRVLRVAKRNAEKAHTAARNSLRHMVIGAPQQLRDQLDHFRGVHLVTACAALRPDISNLADPLQGTKASMRRTAKRVQFLAAELTDTKAEIAALVQATAPKLLQQYGVGPDTASQLLVTAGDNPERLTSEASFAALCGVSPLKASSGHTNRHRLNRGGDRQANSALYTIAMVRMCHEQRTRDYVERRAQQNMNTKEIMRCLKRYIARELLPFIREALTTPGSPQLPERAPTVA